LDIAHARRVQRLFAITTITFVIIIVLILRLA
jgi:hypothetical protein